MGDKRTGGCQTSFVKRGLFRRWLRCALILAVFSSALTATTLAKKPVESYVKKARKYVEQGDIEGVLRLKDRLLIVAPGSAELAFLTGSLHKMMGNDRIAYDALSRAVEKDPSQFLATLSRDLAELAIQQARESWNLTRQHSLLEDALWFLDQEMDPAPDHSAVLLQRLKVLLILDRPDDAKELCVEREIVSADSDALECLRKVLSNAGIQPGDEAVTTGNLPLVGAPEAGGYPVTLPVLWWKVDPVYPNVARVARIEGRVIMQAVVSRDGIVTDLEVLTCTRSGLGFEESAKSAVRQWRYLPAVKGDEAVDVYFTVRIDFELDR